ncbi:hypothetical protein Tco_0723811 [Tanacetum coccineum]
MHVEDLQLGIKSYQKKLNLIKPDTYRSDLKQKTPYTAYSNPRCFIYQNQDKKNRLMCIDELHKFSDGTLNDVWSALDDTLKKIRMKYLPQKIGIEVDMERAGAMIQAIDRQLRNNRIMKSLEKFVGGSLYGGDLRLMERFDTSAGNPVKEILLKLNLPDHGSILTDSKIEVKQQSVKVKELQERCIIKALKLTNQEKYEHVDPKVTSSQDGKVYKMAKRDYAWLMISRSSRSHFHI